MSWRVRRTRADSAATPIKTMNATTSGRGARKKLQPPTQKIVFEKV
jgi:hypothetical protein